MAFDTTLLEALIAGAPGGNWDEDSLQELLDNFNALLIKEGTNAALPEYADNAAALADSAAVGSLYAKADGTVCVVLSA